jgi:type IV pilus assembly protein PilF
MRPTWRTAALVVPALSLLAACVHQTHTGNAPAAPPSAAAQEAARKAELRQRARAHTDLASAYFERKQYQVVLEEIDTALATDPSYVPAWNLRGLTYMSLREDQLADESFQKGFRIAPSDPELGNNYGYFLCSHGREREGLVRLEAVLKDPLYQTPEKPLVNAGQCALNLKDDAAAEDWLRKAVRVQPAEPQGAWLLANLLIRKGHPGEAREVLRPLLRGDNPSHEVLALMVDLDRRLEDQEQLRQHSDLMHRLYPDSVEPPAKAQEVRP